MADTSEQRPTFAQNLIRQAETSIPELDTDSFVQKVLRAEGPLAVIFFLRTCRACKALMVRLARLQDTLETALPLYRVDAEEEPYLADYYWIEVAPTLFLFRHGEPHGRWEGLLPEDLLKDILVEGSRAHRPMQPDYGEPRPDA